MAGASAAPSWAATAFQVVTWLLLAGTVHAQTEPTPYTDVCTNDLFNDAKFSYLCPAVFRVSTVAFDNLYPEELSNVTVIMRPSSNLVSMGEQSISVFLELPSFEIPAEVGYINPDNADERLLPLEAMGILEVGADASTCYNSPSCPVFEDVAAYNMNTGIIAMAVKVGQSMRDDRDTEVSFCCVRLPRESAENDPKYRISAPIIIADEPQWGYTDKREFVMGHSVQRMPYIDPGAPWDFLLVDFFPPLAFQPSVMSLTFRPVVDLGNEAIVRIFVPTLKRIGGTYGTGDKEEIDFRTDGLDWMLFEHKALYDDTHKSITFRLRHGATVYGGQEVTVKTVEGDFELPENIVSNWEWIRVTARSGDDIDEIIAPTPVFQSANVPPVRKFTHTRLEYVINEPSALTDVYFTMSTNRPLFAGRIVYLRLAGFGARVLEVPIYNEERVNFYGECVWYDPPSNMFVLYVNRTVYTNEEPLKLHIMNLILPPALYENDIGLLVWNNDLDCPVQSIDESPAVAGGFKNFTQSQVLFSPEEPRMVSNVTFLLRPSVPFYQGDQILCHLYGFLADHWKLPLIGPDAHRVRNQIARWDAGQYILVFEVADDEMFSHEQALEVTIPIEAGFRLPTSLSSPDGILRIQGVGTIIDMEPFKKTPKLGPDKDVVISRLEFEPTEPYGPLSNSICRMVFSIMLNTDCLANSTMTFKLGGMTRWTAIFPMNSQSGEIILSGARAPLFVGGKGYWDEFKSELTVKVIPEIGINMGEEINFFVEIDQYFVLPYAMYPNDPSYQIEIIEAGLSRRPFRFSTRVNQVEKGFEQSELEYTPQNGQIPYPSDFVEVLIRFRPNVRLPSGNVLRITLFGFTSPFREVPLSAVDQVFITENDASLFIATAKWDQANYWLDMVVPDGFMIYNDKPTVARFRLQAGFRTPPFTLVQNDPRLKIEALENQIIYPQNISDSPRVIARTFMTSTLDCRPARPVSTFQMFLKLQPSMNISEGEDIILTLQGFTNALNRTQVQVMGPNRDYVVLSTASWNQSNFELKMRMTKLLCAECTIDLEIEEAQGFVLPATLLKDDPSLLIRAEAEGIETTLVINQEPIKTSPMVGDGAFPGHHFCMYQYERGTRTQYPRCTCLDALYPDLSDPCNAAELERCVCPEAEYYPIALTIAGFQMQATDSILFIPQGQICSPSILGSDQISPFTAGNGTLNEDGSEITFEGISSVATGYYTICILHEGTMNEAGKVVVRPACSTDLVMVDGTCVEHCPKTHFPVAGACVRDPTIFEEWDKQALMHQVRIRMDNNGGSLADRPTGDPERRYFVYRYTYEMARLLNCDPQRIVVSSLSNDNFTAIIVNTVFQTVMGDGVRSLSDERTPMGLVSLLMALQNDTSSSLYRSAFFEDIDRVFTVPFLLVRMCSDGIYRVFCPFEESRIFSNPAGVTWLLLGGASTFGGLIAIFGILWTVVRESAPKYDYNVEIKARRDIREVNVSQQKEYALSWLEGRYMGEEWEKARGFTPAITYDDK